jgi:hypothetical protein
MQQVLLEHDCCAAKVLCCYFVHCPSCQLEMANENSCRRWNNTYQGISTDTTSDISSTSLPSWPTIGTVSLVLSVSNKHQSCCHSSSSVSDALLQVNLDSEMYFAAQRNLTQPCLAAYCIRCNTPMIQAFYQALQISVSLGKCIWIQSIKGTYIKGVLWML